jgi:hypothetical protein
MKVIKETVTRGVTPAAWDEPLIGSSFEGLFLGGISWVFCRAHEHDGHQY